MKTFIIALATTAALATGAHAANTSFSDGDGFVRSQHKAGQTLLGRSIDREPTASIGVRGNQIITGVERKGGREFNIRYTANPDGSRNVISRSARSSNR